MNKKNYFINKLLKIVPGIPEKYILIIKEIQKYKNGI